MPISGRSALHSAGQSIPELEKARQWLLDCQNQDGGFGQLLGIPSDGDDTAAAIRALLLMGEDENSRQYREDDLP